MIESDRQQSLWKELIELDISHYEDINLVGKVYRILMILEGLGKVNTGCVMALRDIIQKVPTIQLITLDNAYRKTTIGSSLEEVFSFELERRRGDIKGWTIVQTANGEMNIVETRILHNYLPEPKTPIPVSQGWLGVQSRSSGFNIEED